MLRTELYAMQKGIVEKISFVVIGLPKGNRFIAQVTDNFRTLSNVYIISTTYAPW
jgi:hypothetical protein